MNYLKEINKLEKSYMKTIQTEKEINDLVDSVLKDMLDFYKQNIRFVPFHSYTFSTSKFSSFDFSLVENCFAKHEFKITLKGCFPHQYTLTW